MKNVIESINGRNDQAEKSVNSKTVCLKTYSQRRKKNKK